jgi:hypothetical protein
VVVQFGDGSTTLRCVTFDEEVITGYELLRRSGLPLAVEVTGIGAGICQIAGQGCDFPAQPCFCQCQTLGAGCMYWAYAQLSDGGWRASGQGASLRRVRDGDIDGWLWGTGDPATGTAPRPFTIDEICSPAPVAPAQATALLDRTPTAAVAVREALPVTLAAGPTLPEPSAPVTAVAAPSTAPSTAPITAPIITVPITVPPSAAIIAPPPEATADAPTSSSASAGTSDPVAYLVFAGISAVLAALLIAMRRRGPP